MSHSSVTTLHQTQPLYLYLYDQTILLFLCLKKSCSFNFQIFISCLLVKKYELLWCLDCVLTNRNANQGTLFELLIINEIINRPRKGGTRRATNLNKSRILIILICVLKV